MVRTNLAVNVPRREEAVQGTDPHARTGGSREGAKGPAQTRVVKHAADAPGSLPVVRNTRPHQVP